MTTKTAKDYILTGLPFVGGLTVGTYVGHKISKHNETLAWLAWGAIAAFGLGWSISLAGKTTGTSNFSIGNISTRACTKSEYETLLAKRDALSKQMETIKIGLGNPNLSPAAYAQLNAQYQSVKSQLQAVATALCRCEAGFIAGGNTTMMSRYSTMPGTIEVRL